LPRAAKDKRYGNIAPMNPLINIVTIAAIGSTIPR